MSVVASGPVTPLVVRERMASDGALPDTEEVAVAVTPEASARSEPKLSAGASATVSPWGTVR